MLKARLNAGWLFIILTCAPAAFGQGTSERGLHRLSWPDKNWSLDVSLSPFSVTLEDTLKDDLGYWLFATLNADKRSTPNRLVRLNIRLQAAKFNGGVTEFRDFAVKKLKKSQGIRSESVKTFEYKQIPAVKYSLENPSTNPYYPYATLPVSTMRGIEAFFVKDDVWITLVLDGAYLNKQDEALFYAVLDSVKFTDTSTPSSSFDYLFKAKRLIQQKQYAQAAADLNIALGLEQKQRQLDDTHWRNLIALLVDLYTSTGNRARVKELLDYGVGNDPSFPLFHLGLAHHYAALGDMDNTIASLEKAYLHRNNDRRTRGWLWAEPMSHPAFASFHKNEKFRKAVKGMKK